MENQPKLNSSKEVIAYLVEHFPRCFVVEGEARPLKVGIFQDLAERIPAEMNLSKTQLRSALRLYTSSWRYLHGIKAGVQRVDLDGNACGELDAQHVEHARTQLEEAKARVAAHRVKRRADAKGDTVRQQRRPGKEVPADHAAKPRQPKPKKTDSEIHRTLQPEGRKVTDISELTVGQNIRVTAGKNAVDASILEITKDGIRVQLASGLAMIVRPEHLQF